MSAESLRGILQHKYGYEAHRETIFRRPKPKIKAKDRRRVQKARAGKGCIERLEEYNKHRQAFVSAERKRRKQNKVKRRRYGKRGRAHGRY